MSEADFGDELIGRQRRGAPAVIMPLALLSAALVFGIPLARTATAVETAPHAVSDPMALIASPNDPLMIEAIRYARGLSSHAAGGNAWSLPKSDGPTATFATPGSNITLSQKEIAEANFIYPQLRERAKDRAHNSAARPDDAGYTTGEDGE